MNKSFRNMLLGALALTLLIPAAAMAQNSASATGTASATIVQPIAIALDTNLNFGSIVPDVAVGDVTLDPDGTLTVDPDMQHLGGEVVGIFNVTGDGTQAYTVLSIPAITLLGGGDPMAATFSSDCGGCVVGTDALNVGGTLTVNAAQAPGLYSGTFTVTVAYQ